MKGIICLNLNNEFGLKNSIELYKKNYYLVDLYSSIDQPYDKLIKDQSWIKQAFEEKKLTYYDEQDLALINNLYKLSTNENILSQIEYIKIDEEYVIEYLKRNPSLNNKKIIITGVKEFTKEEVEAMKKYEKYNNIFIASSANEEYISVRDFIKTYEKIKDMADKINKYNMSPLEKVMYAYDLVRNRVYKAENKNNNYTISRDLTSVLLTDNIVCLGFANIFKALLKEIGISSDIDTISYSNKLKGHARNVAYINDSKYNVNGVYYFDTTWDSKKEDNSYLRSYKYFAKTKSQINVIDNGKLNKYDYKIDEEFLNDFIQYVTADDIINQKTDSRWLANKISRLITGENMIEPKFICDKIRNLDMEEEIKEHIENLKQYLKLFNKKIDIKTLIKLLFNVRKIEYYENPVKYPLNVNDIIETVIKSGWVIGKAEIKLLRLIFGEEIDSKEEITRIIEEENIDKKIMQIKLTKMLSKIKK